jgi:hypothetical protein
MERIQATVLQIWIYFLIKFKGTLSRNNCDYFSGGNIFEYTRLRVSQDLLIRYNEKSGVDCVYEMLRKYVAFMPREYYYERIILFFFDVSYTIYTPISHRQVV